MKKDMYDIMGIIFKILKIILMEYTQYCMSKMEMQSRVWRWNGILQALSPVLANKSSV